MPGSIAEDFKHHFQEFGSEAELSKLHSERYPGKEIVFNTPNSNKQKHSSWFFEKYSLIQCCWENKYKYPSLCLKVRLYKQILIGFYVDYNHVVSLLYSLKIYFCCNYVSFSINTEK